MDRSRYHTLMRYESKGIASDAERRELLWLRIRNAEPDTVIIALTVLGLAFFFLVV